MPWRNKEARVDAVIFPVELLVGAPDPKKIYRGIKRYSNHMGAYKLHSEEETHNRNRWTRVLKSLREADLGTEIVDTDALATLQERARDAAWRKASAANSVLIAGSKAEVTAGFLAEFGYVIPLNGARDEAVDMHTNLYPGQSIVDVPDILHGIVVKRFEAIELSRSALPDTAPGLQTI